MSTGTKIEWTDETWNPTRGCRRVSEGCRNCYAEVTAARWCGEGMPYEGVAKMTAKGARWTGEGMFVASALDDPLRWTRPRLIFVNSMSDLFFEAFSFEQIAAIFGVMAGATKHTFQVLTKRPERAREFFEWLAAECYEGFKEVRTTQGVLELHANTMLEEAGSKKRVALEDVSWPIPNVWLGVSAENQDTATSRIPILLELEAAVRFVSAEPLLGPITFDELMLEDGTILDAARGVRHWESGAKQRVDALDWIIVGGESGHGARAMELSWVESIVDQLEDTEVALFVKQMGGVWAKASDTSSSKGGDMEDWPAHLRVRQFPGEEREEEEEEASEVSGAQGYGPSEETLSALQYEMIRARNKTPTNYMLLEALQEEVGELATDVLGKKDTFRDEALQVACVALRIFEEGCSPPLKGDKGLYALIELIGRLAQFSEDSGEQHEDFAPLYDMIKARVDYRWGPDFQGGAYDLHKQTNRTDTSES